MSTAGSVRSGEASAPYGPPAGTAGVAAGEPPRPTRRRLKLFRWRGIIPIALGLVLLAAVALLFGERLLRDTLVEAATKALGTEVDVATLRVRPTRSTVELRGIAIADPFDRTRNLVELGLVHVELEPEPLLEKKIVITRLALQDVRTGTKRAVPARKVAAGGLAPRALAALDRWAAQFRVPLLSLTPIDTIRAIVLDPKQLATVQGALALGARADSVRAAVDSGYRALRLQETLDSTQALLRRLQGANVRTLGVDGARAAVADVKRAAARVDSARRRVEALQGTVQAGAGTLQDGVRALDSARRADYAFARGLLHLPSFAAPDIGAALFGPVSIDRFQKALYWATLARAYVPPGLLPREEPGPKRLRRAGSTIHFAKPQSYPDFLLRRADVAVDVTGGGMARGRYVAAATNVTTQPALVGKPTVFALRREAAGSGVEQLRASGVLDHLRARPRDQVSVQAAGVELPGFPLPMLPYRADPGRGTSELRITLDGDQVAARWAIHSGELSWVRADSARALNTMESLVARVLTGVRELDLTAELTGSTSAPKLTVRSNLDRAVADQLRAVAGEELAKAEARARAEVDRIVDERTAPVKAKVADVRAQAERKVADAKARLEEQKQKLDAQLKALSGGLLSLPRAGT